MSRLPPAPALSGASRGHSIRAGTYEDDSQHMPGNYAAVPTMAYANRRFFGADSADASRAPGERCGPMAGGGGFNSAGSAPLRPLASVKLRQGTNEDASQLMPEVYRVGSAMRGEFDAHVAADNAERSLRAQPKYGGSARLDQPLLLNPAADPALTRYASARVGSKGAAADTATVYKGRLLGCNMAIKRLQGPSEYSMEVEVYKGRLLGCNMAIKRLQGGGWQGPSEYSMEVDVLSRMRHPHIVLLMGHCPDPNAMCILYEYLPGGSLQEYLAASARNGSGAGGEGVGDGSRSSAVFHGTGSGMTSCSVANSAAGSIAGGTVNQVLRQPLAWYDRVRILSEVSGALLYLHQHSPPIAHRDLKPDNVLLDGNRMSKLGDVGLARLIAEDDYNVTARVQGTVGYIDPEEVATCEISVLSDVYAFGLIVLQLLMGEPQVKVVHRLLTDTAAMVDAETRRAGRVGGVCSEPWSAAVDAVLARLDKSGGEWRADVARQLAEIGVRCADRARARRPDLQKKVQPVLARLEEEVRGEGDKGRTDVDNQLLCPISQMRMTDPVVAADGFTYERYVIEQWLERNDKSPITGAPFSHSAEFLHVKPGKGAAFVRTKLRNFITGNTVERTFRAGESVDEASVVKDVKQFTYLDGEDFVFMDMVTYEETRVTKAQLGDRVKFLKEGMECNVLTWNDKVIDLELPITLKVKVVQTDPGVKGDTAGGGGTKPAIIETGATVSVPLFIEEGEAITVDTRTGSYMGRA
ncbi:unnamed protein product [Closterium sp. NIES-65]|nr:unnamed protein product [Closterium sp. NIES-65]